MPVPDLRAEGPVCPETCCVLSHEDCNDEKWRPTDVPELREGRP